MHQFEQLLPLYTEWNAKINVISRKDMEHLYLHHVLHSLSIAKVIEFQPGTKVLDIGTGGGFPGVPLAIFFPNVQFHLVDSINKKLKIIEAVKEATGLDNITTQHTRAEDIRNRKFDFAVSRAVAPLKDLWSWSKPLLNTAGNAPKATTAGKGIKPGLICLKGGDLKQEISESGLKPRKLEISDLFEEEFFKEKYILYTPLQ